MAKSDRSVRDIKLDRAYTPPRKPAWGADVPVHGFDSETADGSVFALSFAPEDGDTRVLHDLDYLSGRDIMDALTNRVCRSSINVWYNLDFDANALLNHILDREGWAEVVVTGETTVDVDGREWAITYIPSKFLQLQDQDRNTYLHFDVSQFFYGSLDDAGVEWLDRGKLDSGIDTSQFGADDGQANQYIRDRIGPICKYAKRDAELVRDIFNAMIDEGEALRIPMGKPFSTGYLAESYCNQHFDYKPGVGPFDMAALAWRTYFGGRFEVFKRGDVGPVAGPDINSAYPAILSDLPDPATLNWRHPDDPDLNVLHGADYGFVDITVTTSDNPIQPFAAKDSSGLVYYPRMHRCRTQVILPTFLFALDAGLLDDYFIHDCWLAHTHVGTTYPFTFVTDLYDDRKTFERDGYDKKAQLLKIVLNSLYGKTCQTTPKAQRLDDLDRKLLKADDGDDYTEWVLTDQQLPDALKYKYPSGIVEHLSAGAWFNPFLATHITGLTRLELHRQIHNYNLTDNVIMFATDSMMVERDAFEASDFANELVGPELGAWDYDYKGEAFVVGPGVYEVDRDDGTIKTKSRGFDERALLDTHESLRRAAQATAESDGDVIDVQTTRPRSAAELLWQNKSLADVAAFAEQHRELSADFDAKRIWPGDTDFSTLLAACQLSAPREAHGSA